MLALLLRVLINTGALEALEMREFLSLAALLVVGATLGSASLASAGEQVRAAGPGARAVLICGTDAATRRAFTREHGAPPVFVSAREALSVRSSDPAWSTPRCMTAREHARFTEAVSTYAAAR